MSPREEIQNLVEDACHKDKVLQAITKVIQNAYLMKVLVIPKDAEENIKELYSSWDTLEAITVLAARIDVEHLSDFVFGLASSYLTTMRAAHLGKDVNALTDIGTIEDRKELLALIALYFYGIIIEKGN